METSVDCIPCLVHQTLDAARRAGLDDARCETLLRDILTRLGQEDFRQPPPAIARMIHRRIRRLTNDPDPYREAKARFNTLAVKLYDELKVRIEKADDPFDAAVRIAIAGNIIDLGVKGGIGQADVHRVLEETLTCPIHGEPTSLLRQAVEEADDVLYIADNAGEIGFDRLLIEIIGIDKVTLAVRGSPVINDATREDAKACALPETLRIIDNGTDVPGTLLRDCSPLFLDHFSAADVVIAKGQGNYETLSDSPRSIFHLLRAKCPAIAADLDCRVGDNLLRFRQPPAGNPRGNTPP